MSLEIGAAMPPLDAATMWFGGTAAHAAAEIADHPTLVYFWTSESDGEDAAIKRVTAWRDQYVEQGLRTVAVYVPQGEDDVETARDAIVECNITEPCAIDVEGRLREAFALEEAATLPVLFLFDRQGKLQSTAEGARDFAALASEIERAL